MCVFVYVFKFSDDHYDNDDYALLKCLLPHHVIMSAYRKERKRVYRNKRNMVVVRRLVYRKYSIRSVYDSCSVSKTSTLLAQKLSSFSFLLSAYIYSLFFFGKEK